MALPIGALLPLALAGGFVAGKVVVGSAIGGPPADAAAPAVALDPGASSGVAGTIPESLWGGDSAMIDFGLGTGGTSDPGGVMAPPPPAAPPPSGPICLACLPPSQPFAPPPPPPPAPGPIYGGYATGGTGGGHGH